MILIITPQDLLESYKDISPKEVTISSTRFDYKYWMNANIIIYTDHKNKYVIKNRYGSNNIYIKQIDKFIRNMLNNSF